MSDRDQPTFVRRERKLAERLAASGMEMALASRLVDAWRDEAYRRGLGRYAPAYWREATTWIEEQAASWAPPAVSPREQAEADLERLLDAFREVAAAHRVAATASGRAHDPPLADPPPRRDRARDQGRR